MNMISNKVLSGLKKELDAIVGKEYDMTKANYYALMSIKNRVRDLSDPERDGVRLDPMDEFLRLEILKSAYVHLNKMEAYYEEHGNEWMNPIVK